MGFFLNWFRQRVPEHLLGSRWILGSTGSGKSEGELIDLVKLAETTPTAIVVLDGHGPLAQRLTQVWFDAGYQNRLLYEPLTAVDRTLSWPMLTRSQDTHPAKRRIEDTEIRDDLVHCFLAPRGLESLANRALTKEWLEGALDLVIAQPQPEELSILLSVFQIGSPELERLLRNCDRPDIVFKFRRIEELARRNFVQFELQTGPSRRLIEQLCDSEVVRLRSVPSSFSWKTALEARSLILFDGGGIRSRELKRGLFLLASLQVIQAVRRHYAKSQKPLSVVLVLEEAGALDLVSPFILLALQELRKAGLSIHLITQSSADFWDKNTLERILANTPVQVWYQVLAPADQALGATVLLNASFDSDAVHFQRPRILQKKQPRLIKDDYFKSPQLQEQETRTRLARLAVGERWIRTRTGVLLEQTKPFPKTFDSESFEKQSALIRQSAVYRVIPNSFHNPDPSAAQRLTEFGSQIS